MSDRVSLIASRVVGAGPTDEWRDGIHAVSSRLEDLVVDMAQGDLTDLGWVDRALESMRHEMVGQDDLVLVRDVDRQLSEVKRMLNEAEGERRRHQDKCAELGHRAHVLSGIFDVLERRI